jgi:hypothetical protein
VNESCISSVAESLSLHWLPMTGPFVTVGSIHSRVERWSRSSGTYLQLDPWKPCGYLESKIQVCILEAEIPMDPSPSDLQIESY